MLVVAIKPWNVLREEYELWHAVRRRLVICGGVVDTDAQGVVVS
jgi:hypothetical protein